MSKTVASLLRIRCPVTPVYPPTMRSHGQSTWRAGGNTPNTDRSGAGTPRTRACWTRVLVATFGRRLSATDRGRWSPETCTERELERGARTAPTDVTSGDQ